MQLGCGFSERLSGFFRQMAFLFFCPSGRVCLRRLVLFGVPTALAHPCIVIGLLGSPLCGAAPTFFAGRKKSRQKKAGSHR